MPDKKVIKILVENNLKVTPQRTALLESLLKLQSHPTAEDVIEYLRKNYPNISVGTVYKNLEKFVEKGIIKRVKTSDEILRYDAVGEMHHHLYCTDSDRIEDFYDEELNKMLEEYFSNKHIPNFNIKDIKVQIVGNFTNEK
ncbi:MAG: transcriptional repressor [Bacteroidales bacterium]|nr:transcriptional repressor [Bacteroidales bacterium]